MKLAITQPYLFPYLGYFQLIQAVDKLVVYDDVQFTRRGWINRNVILFNGNPHRFTMPVNSHRLPICEISLPDLTYWKRKFFTTIDFAYGKAPFFVQVKSLIVEVFSSPTQRLIDILMDSLHMVCDYLDIHTPFVMAIQYYDNRQMKKETRILDICRDEGADIYINLPGGKDLYNNDFFALHKIKLHFLEYQVTPYFQKSKKFTPFLSVLDVMMFNDPAKIKNEMLYDYKLA